MYIFLDDMRLPDEVWIKEGFPKIPFDDWHIVRDIDQFKEMVRFNLPRITHIAFDHDLADGHYAGDNSDERTGYDCAKFLVDQCIDRDLPLPGFSCHSMNPAGRTNILEYLEGYKRQCAL